MSDKRILTLFLAFVMLFTVAGCKGNQNNPDVSPTPDGVPVATVDVLSTVTPKPKQMQPVTNDMS